MSQAYNRRTFVGMLAGATAFAGLGSKASAAASLPSGTITIVVPFDPGGANDIIARAVAQHMTETGATVVVDNRPGASGSVGAQYVARSEPDGRTLLMAPIGVLAINPWLFSQLGYDPVKDFAPLTLAGTVPNALIVHPSVPAKTVAELIAYAKANPGKLNFASMGNGTTGHLCGEMFKKAAGVDILHVPYKGSAPALKDLLSGQVQLMFDNLPTALPHMRAEKLRGLAVTSPARHPLAPEVPTLKESGVDAEAVAWFGFVAPVKTPGEIQKAISDSMIAALKSDKVKAQLEKVGVTISANQPAEFAALIASESKKWRQVVADAGAKIDN
ncbi:tripartite-type tricarboxylate transporter receptor subunit TctC [Microvirga flocculans]|uniref:Tripartite-type tricarboxylate transporter receptor subunit TctC n=1 Tax=Microvirga flocculans TaxID=217168 RepID=A0A7W6N966_9HYPH|nr:tripartite tricarboxylate transporter substrate binding protein [Microvirga flocculans]MBB4041175.1 tripartite-type tricarboxylate transporter receptor subunit TctC [Microvirga flocculans]